jgi:hypothetical protein
MLDEAPSHEPPATQSNRVDGTSYHSRQPGQQVDQSARDALNKRARMGGERQLEVESRSMPCAGGPEAAAQQVRRGGQPESSEEGGRSR